MTALTTGSAIRGRDHELSRLSELVAAGRSSTGLLAIVGDAGQGKTTLLNAAVDQASAGGSLVLAASGIESEANLAFAGLHQLLLPVLRSADDLPAPQLAALRSAFGVSDGHTPGRFLVGLAVLTLLSEVAEERPLLVAIDDAQWLDRGSLDALGFASRRLHAEPISILITARHDSDLAAFGSDVALLDLQPLQPADAAALLDDAAPGLPNPLRTRILDEAGGNPLAVVEFARSGIEFGAWADDAVALAPTARLERLFAGRLAALPDETQRALLIAAASDAAEMAAVLRATAATGLSQQCFVPAERDGLITMSADAFRFRHPILRSLIYHAASQADRRAAHLALAAALDADPERAVWHLASVTSEPDEAVAATLEQAAGRARVRAGYGAAWRAMHRAATLSPDPGERARRLVGAVVFAFTAGDASTVLELDRELRQLTSDPVVLGQSALWVAQVEVLQGAGRASAALSIPAIQSLLAADPGTAIGLLAVAAGCSYLEGDRVRAGAVDDLVKAIPGVGDEAWRLYVLAAADPAGNAHAVAPHIDAFVRDTAADGTMLRITSHIPWYLDDHAAAAVLLARCVEVTRGEGGMGALSSYIVPLALTDVWHGRLSDAVMHATEGVRIALEVDQPAQAAVGLGIEALVAAMRGQTEVLQERADAARRFASGGLSQALVTWALGIDALVSGHPDIAYADLRRLFDPDEPASHREVARWAIADLVEAGIAASTVDDLEELTAEAEGLASVGGTTRATMVARRARAVLDDGPSNEAFETALGVDGAAAWPFEIARTRLSYGVWLRRHRQIVAAREPLRAAADAFERIGADPWHARARAELRAAGEASVVHRRGMQDELTPQQRQVAQLAARGLSNREIGAQLYLSPRTISFHLYNIFPKLGITTRSQLAGAIGTELVEAGGAAQARDTALGSGP
jgi:DNA-binding CsgD family transcriptional regulator